MTMKKRIIYMDDETWETIRQLSDGQHITMSEVVRRALLPPFNHVVAPEEQSISPQVDVWTSIPGKMPSDHTVTPGQAPRSFTQFNPVPKVAGKPRRK